MVYHKMNETQKKRYQYITAPATVIAAFTAVIWVIVSWTTMNFRIQALENFKSEVNIVEIQTTLKEIQIDLQRVKNALQK